ncbi:MAG: hypothetical protein M1814_006073 [Vezdaea aestivalis]|nr:MAG: hypothetical protein M1814_006073 [Vezdaea aestivalis]
MDEEATQPNTQPLDLDSHAQTSLDGFYPEELADVICTLHPSNDFTRKSIASVARDRPQHVLSHDRFSTLLPAVPRHDDKLEGDMGPPDAPRPADFDIALRMSSDVLDPALGFTFGRSKEKSDIMLLGERRISQMHFRIYLTGEGVLMLQDNSTNGTFVDRTLLQKDGQAAGSSSHTIQHGSAIAVSSGRNSPELGFYVKLPLRSGQEASYERNFRRYRDKINISVQAKQFAKAAKLGGRPLASIPSSTALEALLPTQASPNVASTTPFVTQYQPAVNRKNGALPKTYRQNNDFLLAAGASRLQLGRQWNPHNSKYSLLAEIGKGAFAMVFKASRRSDGKLFAVKELDKKAFKKANVIEINVSSEVQIMSKLSHPNIVQYVECIDKPNFMYIIMEFVPNGNVGTLISDYGAIPESQVKSMTFQCLEALEYMQQQRVTHRDIKPDNILIVEHNPLHVKLADFGLSKVSNTDETMLTTFCGTLYYCAPEVYDGYGAYAEDAMAGRLRRKRSRDERAYDSSCDIWSLGAVVFHALTNRPPFDNYRNKDGMLRDIMKNELDLGPLKATGASKSAGTFIKRLLNRNPRLRPSAADCLHLPWLNRFHPADTEVINLDPDATDEVSLATSQLSLVDATTIQVPDESRDFYSESDYSGIMQTGQERSFTVETESVDADSQISQFHNDWEHMVVRDDSQVWDSRVHGVNVPGNQLFGEVPPQPAPLQPSEHPSAPEVIAYPNIPSTQSFPSLLGTDVMMGQMNMASPRARSPHTPHTPSTPSTRSNPPSASSSARTSKRAHPTTPPPQSPTLPGKNLRSSSPTTPRPKRPRAFSRHVSVFPPDEAYWQPGRPETLSEAYCDAKRASSVVYQNWIATQRKSFSEKVAFGQPPPDADIEAYVQRMIKEEKAMLRAGYQVKFEGEKGFRKAAYEEVEESFRAEPKSQGSSNTSVRTIKPVTKGANRRKDKANEDPPKQTRPTTRQAMSGKDVTRAS